ncbi:MAG: hypothetical protein OXG98_08560 [Gemmatimonadetes bacterium]|nr:hypothetical protein [Gemmatimonadota bacterium]
MEDADGVGERNVALTHAAAVPSDNTHAYHGITIRSVLVSVEDNDVRTVVASTDALALAEADDPGTTEVKENEASYTLRLSHAPSDDVTVTLSSSGVALHLSPGELTFTPSNWNEPQTVTVTAIDDDIDNEDEQSTGTIVHAVSASGADYADAPAVAVSATVADDDGAPVLSIASAAVAEGNTGSTNLGFTVTLAPASGKTVTVAWADVGTGTATAGADYATVTGGTLTFAAGETTKQLNVSVTGDTADESDETVALRLSSPSNATLEGGGATLDAAGTILDDDGIGVIVSLARSGSAVTLTEGTAEGSLALPGDKLRFTVTLSRALFAGERIDAPLVLSGKDITAGDFAGLAASDGDGLNTGVSIENADTLTPTVIFAGRGARVATLELEPTDTALENDEETVTVALGSNQQFAADTHTNVPGGAGRHAAANGIDATVADDEFIFGFTKTGRHDVAEDDGTASLALTLSRALSRDIDVSFVYLNRDTHANPQDPENDPGPWKDAATKGEDYEAAYARPEFATIKAGATSFTLEFDLVDDDTVEPTERLRIQAAPAWLPIGVVPDHIDVYIADNDPTVTIAADSSAVTEGAGAAFTVRRNAVSASPMTVNLNVAESGGGDFVAAGDEGDTTVTIPANEAQESYTVATQTDQTPEASSEVTVTVRPPTTPGTYFVGKANAASVTVRDPSLEVALAPAKASVSEADNTDAYLDFTVTKPNVDAGESLHYTLCFAGTAMRDENSSKAEGEDYRLVSPAGSSSLQWDSGCVAYSLGRNDTSHTWRLQVFGDTTPESDETVTVTLAASSVTPLPVGWSIAAAGNPATYKIVNDDALPVTLAVGATSINESGNGNSTDITVTLGRALVAGETVTVPLSVTGATVTDHYTLAKKAGATNTGVTLSTASPHSAQDPAVVFAGADAQTATLLLAAVNNNEAVARSVSIAFGSGARAPSKDGFGDSLEPSGSPQTVAIVNDDVKGLVLSPAALTVDEGTAATYTVALATEPVGGTVTVTVAGTSGTDLTLDTDPDQNGNQATLAFTASDWHSAQTVTVTAAHDNGPGNDSATLTHTASGADYGSIAKSLPVTIDDDEEPTPTLSLALAPGAPATVAEDGDPVELRVVVESGRFNYDDTLFDEVFLKATGTATRADYRLEYRWRDGWRPAPPPALPVAVYSNDVPQYQRFRLVPRDDGRTEGAETLRLALVPIPDNRVAHYSPYILGEDTVVELTLTDPVPPGTPVAAFATGEASAPEDGGAVSVTVTFDPAPTAALTLNYTVDGSATAGEDYEALSGTLAVSAGAASADVEVAVTDDAVADPGETVVLTLDAGEGYAVGGTHVHTLTIADDEAPPPAPPPPPAASIAAGPSITEGGNAVFTVSVAPAPTAPVFVNVNVADSGHFAKAGQTGARAVRVGRDGAGAFSVPTVDDGTEEPDGMLTATIRTGEGYAPSGTDASASVAVRDDDPPLVSIAAGPAITEGGEATFTLTASPAPKAAITVNVTVTDSGAFAEDGQDGARQVAIGTSGTATLTVKTKDDTGVDEPDGTLTATIGTGTGYAPSGTAARATVAVADNDDPPPQPLVSIAPDEVVTEGGDVTFTLTAAPAPKSALTVNIEVTERGSFAEAGATGTKMVDIDTAGTGTLTVGTDNDTGDEPHGSITATVKAGTGYAPSATAGAATVTVRDDDDPPTISIAAGTAITEGAAATFTLTAHPAPGAAITVHLEVADSGDFVRQGQQGQRTVGIDTSGTGTLTVKTVDDNVDEPGGTLAAEVRPSPGYTPSGAHGTASVAVADNDAAPAAEFGAATAQADEDAGTVQVRIALGRPSASALALTYTVGGSATAGSDFTIANSGSLTVPALATSADIPVTLIDDADEEPAETVVLTLTGGTGYTLGRRPAHTLTIAASDTTPTVTVTGGGTITEGGSAAFTLTAHPAPATDLAVNLSIADAPGSDFVAPGDEGSDTVTLPAGKTSASYHVATVRDEAHEADGPVTATLAGGEGYVLGSPHRAGVTVEDDDAPLPAVSVTAGAAIDEGGRASFTVTATPAPATPLRVTLYIVQQGRVAAPGATGEETVTVPTSGSLTHRVKTVDDSEDEPNGSVTATVRAGAGYTVAAADEASVTVRDNDESNYAGIEVSIGDASAKEGEDLEFVISLSRAAPGPITVQTLCFAGKANIGYDFECYGNSVTFEQGERTLTYRVWAVEDDIDEGNETFELEIRNPRPAVVRITRAIATGTIENDGPLPAAWLGRFGRGLAEQAVDGITARLQASRAPGLSGRVLGRGFTVNGGATDRDRPQGIQTPDRHGPQTPDSYEPQTPQAHGSETPVHGPQTAEVHESQAPTVRRSGSVRHSGLDPESSRQTFIMQTPDRHGPQTAAVHGPQAAAQGQPPAGDAVPTPAPGLHAAGSQVPPGVRIAPGVHAASGSVFPDDARETTYTTRTVTLAEALAGSAFSYTRAPDDAGGSVALWGRGLHARFSGADGALGLDGELSTGLLGADYARANWQAGAALMLTGADGSYRGEHGEGKVEAALTSVLPYAALRWAHTDIWGALGHGRGRLTLSPTRESGALTEILKTDLGWYLAAGGVRSHIGALLGEAGPELALVGDAQWTRTTSKEIVGMESAAAGTARLRLGLEGGWSLALPGENTLQPALEAGLRYDAGDAETGLGIELGAALRWESARLGLTAEVEGRTLVAHRDTSFENYGLSAALAFDPDLSSLLGPSLTVTHRLGGPSSGGLDALFASELPTSNPGGAQGHWSAEAAWGLPVLRGRFVGSPTLGYTLGGGAGDYTLGWQLTPAGPHAPDLSIDLSATRRTPPGAAAEYEAAIRVTSRW